MDKLSYCPFCGETEDLTLRVEPPPKWDPFYKKSKGGHILRVTCGSCGVGINFGYAASGISKEDAERSAIKEFNQRFIPPDCRHCFRNRRKRR